MVASGTVRVLGWRKVADAFVRPRDSASVHVEVRARGWTPLEMPEAPKFAGQGNTTIVPKPNLDMTYGLFHLVPPDFTVKTVLSGPNRGYSWLDPEPKLPASKVYVSPALDGKGAWAAIQTGEYNGSKMSPNGRPYCTLADLQAFKKKVERHEGLTSDANSHYGIWKTQLAKSDVHKKLESIVVASSTAAEDTVQRRNDIKAAGQLAYDRWQEWKEDHQPLQVAFDSTEYGNDGIPKMAGCDFVPFPTVQTPDSTR